MAEEVVARKRQAAAMRKQGLNNVEIGRRLGVSGATVARYLNGQPPPKNAKAVSSSSIAKTAPRNNEARLAERVAQAFEMRLAGLSHGAIAAKMKTNPRTVRRYIELEISERIQPSAQILREIELNRLDRYLEKLDPQIEAGDVKAIMAALRVAERRSNLLGLDSPVRIDAVITEVTPADLAMQELLNEVEARNAAIEATIVGPVTDVETVA
jgi:DNA-binding CsgD family transcriptional regulator